MQSYANLTIETDKADIINVKYRQQFIAKRTNKHIFVLSK